MPRANSYERRGPISVPFSPYEANVIYALSGQSETYLFEHLVNMAWDPRRGRQQRLIQEAIERKRANGGG